MTKNREHPLTIYLQTLLAIILTIPFIFITGTAIAAMIFLVLVIVLHNDIHYGKTHGNTNLPDNSYFFADDDPHHTGDHTDTTSHH